MLGARQGRAARLRAGKANDRRLESEQGDANGYWVRGSTLSRKQAYWSVCWRSTDVSVRRDEFRVCGSRRIPMGNH